jgi:hypothetical protein
MQHPPAGNSIPRPTSQLRRCQIPGDPTPYKGYFHAVKSGTRSDTAESGRDLDDADHKGYLIARYVLNPDKYVMDSRGRSVWRESQRRVMERATVWMRHYRNHPAVVMWVAGVNLFNSEVDADPRHVVRRGWNQADPRWQRLLAAGKEMFDGLRELAPRSSLL